MQPLLESFESFFYVLVNTLPVGIGIGLLFFGIGFLFTNPRIKRLRQQITNYKEEVQRMSRRQAQVTTQHQELLESLQSAENENLALQSSLETKNDELIGLLDRLNNIAGDAEPAALGDGDSISTENTRLRKRIAELTGRLRTSESALQDRKVELTRARKELARVGVPQEAAAGGSHGGDDGWRLDPPGNDDASSSDNDSHAPPADTTAAQDAIDALVEQQKGADLPGLDPESPQSEEDLEATAKRIFSDKKEDPEADDTAESEKAPKTPEERTDDLEDQLANFEERLRAKEAEFFALQEQLSFGTLDIDSPAAGTDATPAAAPGKPAGKSSDVEKAQATSAAPKAMSKSAASGISATPFPPLSGNKPPSIPIHPEPSPPEPPSRQLFPGEQLIFRGSDPALWGKTTGAGLVRPEDVRKSTKFLRLRRSDTGQSVIIRVAKKHLRESGSAESTLGWNGKGEILEGAHHLGIYDHSLSQEVETRFGAGGWGFGHFTGHREGQAYSWAGVSIPKTDFEISTLSKLPDAKTLKESETAFIDSPTIDPSMEEELVFFHSAYPEIWNKNTVDGKGGFAFHLSRVPKKTRFIQVRRPDSGSAVIVPISRDKTISKGGSEKKLGWNGSNEFFFAAHHLGICDPSSANEVEIAYGCGGYGFGHLVDSTDRQAVAWAGKAINRIPLEFTAIARELTAEENELLLKA